MLLPPRPAVAHSGFEVRRDKMPPVSNVAERGRRIQAHLCNHPQDIVGRSSTWVTNALAPYYPPRDIHHQHHPSASTDGHHPPFNIHLHGQHSPVSDFNTPPLSHSAFSAFSASTGYSSSVASTSDLRAGTSSTTSSPNQAGLDHHMQRLEPFNQDKTSTAISDIPRGASTAIPQPYYSSLPSPTPHHPVSQTQLIGFLTPLFPYHATIAIACARLLELVLPHTSPVLIGAAIDLPAHSYGVDPRRPGKLRIDPGGRTVYLSLPSFSPSKSLQSSEGESDSHDHNLDIDIRDHLTSLLDLVADALDATELVLVLDRRNRQDEELREFLHALAYVGGIVLRPGKVRGGFEWDDKRWVLVAIEL